MAAIERKINGTFAPVPGGYAQQINEQTTLFVPEFTVARYDTETGELFGHAPDYEALEAAKSPAVHADKPGEYSYCYEMERPRQAATSPPVFHTTASIIISVRSATISRSSAGAVYPTTSSAAHTPSPAAPMTSSKSSTA